jgi:hypothetical protein
VLLLRYESFCLSLSRAHTEFVCLLYGACKDNVFCIAEDKLPAEVRQFLHYERKAPPEATDAAQETSYLRKDG